MSLSNVWFWLKDLHSILRLCRSSLIVLGVGFAFLLLVPQGRDVVLALGESPLRDRLSPLVWFFLAAGFWALNVWYWARVMLQFEWRAASQNPGGGNTANRFRRRIPRLLGTAAFIVVALAFIKAAVETGGGTRVGHMILAGWSITLAVIFYLLVAVRRKALNATHVRLSRVTPLQRGTAGRVVGLLKVREGGHPDAYRDRLQSLRDLEEGPRVFLGLLLLVTSALFITFSITAGAAVHFQAASILLLAGAGWTPVGALLVYFGSRYEFPVLSVILLALVLFSFVNDNHEVRTLQPRRGPDVENVAEHFKAWLDVRSIDDSSPEQGYPVVVVASEGGGIRAAYWTATVLGRLQDMSPPDDRFADHVYAISGVSGGSLGGSVFAALVKEQRSGQVLACGDEKRGPIEACADRMLKADFLSPTLAAMLYPDLVQRFLFWPVRHFDRSRALERAWETAWNDLPGVRPGRFGDSERDPSFDDLWRDERTERASLYRVPLLFLNATWVETGKRVITSPLPITPGEFDDAVDFLVEIGDEIRLSSAVHNSARFTFVSPAGTVKRMMDGRRRVWGHLVDGGYFENSGATTALEVLEAMQEEAGGRWRKIKPIVLMITNDPNLNKQNPPLGFLKELRSPAVAFLNTRGARGSYSRSALKAFVQEDCESCFVEIDLEGVKGVPLGWVLSNEAVRTMNKETEAVVQEALAVLRPRDDQR